MMNNDINGGKCFTATQELMSSVLIPRLQDKLGSRSTFTFIQYSGIKHLAKSYKAGIDNGWADKNAGLEHYRVEIEKTSLDQSKQSVNNFTTRK